MSGKKVSRRTFLRGAKGATLSTMLASGITLTEFLGAGSASAAQVSGCGLSEDEMLARIEAAYLLREGAARTQRDIPLPEHPCNGDETAYPDGSISFSKSLPHNSIGEVLPEAYQKLLDAVHSGDFEQFEEIPMGGELRLVNPQAAFSFEMEGPDPQHMVMPAPPSFASAESASEMAELYWMATTRDIPFSLYSIHPDTLRAAEDLSRMADFRGPKVDGSVTDSSLFRGITPGDLTGPYVSQFLLQPIPYGATLMDQKMKTTQPGIDHVTSYQEWLALQNGHVTATNSYDSTSRYIRTGRDLAEYVHVDMAYHPYVSAAFILKGMNAPFDSNNPYVNSKTQVGFGTFGYPHIFYLFGSVCNRALKCAWFQKWVLSRRLRPDAFAGRLKNHLSGLKSYNIHSDLLESEAVSHAAHRTGSALLSQAYAEGSPQHPAYPSGHATMAGACITVLKAFFDEDFVLQNPIESNASGTTLIPYTGEPLTVGGELNKLAANIGMGRDFAGIHYRSDIIEGMRMGEAVAINVLAELRETYYEKFSGFRLTKLDGTQIRV